MVTRFSVLVLAALAPFSSAQDLLIPDITHGRIMRFDATTGALIDANAIDVSQLSSGVVIRPAEVLFAPNGELWMGDLLTDRIERFAGDGSSYLGSIDIGAMDVIGGAVFDDSVWMTKLDLGMSGNISRLVQLDADGTIVGEYPTQIPFDLEPYTFQGLDGLLVSDNLNDSILFLDVLAPTTTALFFSSGSISIPWQVYATPSGRVWLVEGLISNELWELDASGLVLDEIDLEPFGLTNSRGVHELPNGNVLFTTEQGVHILDRSAGTVSTVWSGGAAYYISEETTGMTYCGAELNSSGLPASLSARGSRSVADNEVELLCRTMSMNATAYFLTSLQDGFSANPGGSSGNLCLSGAIGRFIGAGQVQFSGTEGAVSLGIDLTNHPTPGGPTQVASGETWYYQCWFRDTTGGQPTSNFSNGVGVTFL